MTTASNGAARYLVAADTNKTFTAVATEACIHAYLREEDLVRVRDNVAGLDATPSTWRCRCRGSVWRRLNYASSPSLLFQLIIFIIFIYPTPVLCSTFRSCVASRPCKG